jgi:hypothetical protein
LLRGQTISIRQFKLMCRYLLAVALGQSQRELRFAMWSASEAEAVEDRGAKRQAEPQEMEVAAELVEDLRNG